MELTVRNALAAWSDDAALGPELIYENRASRAWSGQVHGADVVVKLTFDGPPYVEPGLRVAEAVERRTGIETGRPVLDGRGRFVVPIAAAEGCVYSLAVLALVTGRPVTTFDNETAAAAGRLLARVHGALSSDAPAVPGDLLSWFAEHSAHDVAVCAALARLGEAGGLSWAVLYGDPSPEVLRQPDGTLALIDWGTPSRGPVMYDVATWLGHIERHSALSTAGARFLAAYRSEAPVAPAEYELLSTFEVLWRSLVQI